MLNRRSYSKTCVGLGLSKGILNIGLRVLAAFARSCEIRVGGGLVAGRVGNSSAMTQI